MKTEQYYMDKLLKMGDEFTKAVIRKDWFQAKYLYDKASTVCSVSGSNRRKIRESCLGDTTRNETRRSRVPLMTAP